MRAYLHKYWEIQSVSNIFQDKVRRPKGDKCRTVLSRLKSHILKINPRPFRKLHGVHFVGSCF